MDEALQSVLERMAALVDGTEVAAFAVPDEAGRLPLQLLAHIRPGDADEAVKAAAVEAFQQLILPCVRAQQDGALEIGPADPQSGKPQFCLVGLLRQDERIRGAVAIITRCRDERHAVARLDALGKATATWKLE